MATIDRYLGKVFCGDALDLLRTMPVESVDACIADPMYGVASRFSVYDWGPDPSRGDPGKHWRYHRPIYEHCRRVLKPGGVLAWSAGVKLYNRFSPARKWRNRKSNHGIPALGPESGDFIYPSAEGTRE